MAHPVPRKRSPLCFLACLGLALGMSLRPLGAQRPSARDLILTAARAELQADRNDHTPLQYLDHDMTPEHNTLFYMVETPQGDLGRELQVDGHPLSPAQRLADDARIRDIIANPGRLDKKKKDEAQDEDQAAELLELLPHAFLWSYAAQGAQGPLVTLDFRPDPGYSPHSMEDRVFAAMTGQVIIDRQQQRIYAMRGTLTEDVRFGYGLFGSLKKGGTFEVQRREVLPGHWQITESHVHLAGKALFFKTIGDQEDEQRGDFKLSPARNLADAGKLLPNP